MLANINRLILVLLVITILSGCAGSYETLEPSVKRDMDTAEHYLNAGKTVQSERYIRRALKNTKQKKDLYLYCIKITSSEYSPLKQTLSVNLCEEIMDLSERNKLDRRLTKSELKYVLLNDYVLYRLLNRKQEMFVALERAMALYPRDPGIANALGYSYADDGVNLKRALYLTRFAVQSSPNEAMYIDSLGWTYFKLKDYTAAVRELRRAVYTMPSDAELRYHLGAAFYRAGDHVRSKIELSKALAIDSTLMEAKNLLNNLRKER